MKNFALLDFTKAESYLTFFQNDLPAFNRYFTISEKEGVFDLDRFIETVNLSFQYFRSEFKIYELDRFVIVGCDKNDSIVSSLKEGLQIKIDAISTRDLIKHDKAEVENIKALGAARRDFYPYKFKPVLRRPKESAEGAVRPITIPSLRVGQLSLAVSFAAVFSLFLSLFLGNKIFDERSKLKTEETKISRLKEKEGFLEAEAEENIKKQREKIVLLKELTVLFTEFYNFFEKLGDERILPYRLWFEDLNITQRGSEHIGYLTGYVFRNNDYEEREGLNEFLTNLRKESAITTVFSNIEIESSDKKDLRGFQVTRFSIKLH